MALKHVQLIPATLKLFISSITTTFTKVFNAKSVDVIRDCQTAFGLRSFNEQILTRKIHFVRKCFSSPNSICSITLTTYVKNDLLTLQNQFANIYQINGN